MATRAIFLGLERALRGRASVYFEAPLDAARIDSEPEPDVLVCSNPDEWAYRSERTKPVLVIEVADSSLEYDLGEKAGLYAVAGVPEYWVVNLIDRVLVVFREPEPDEGSYRVRFSLEESSRVTPAAWPELSFAVSDFLPRNPSTESETAEERPLRVRAATGFREHREVRGRRGPGPRRSGEKATTREEVELWTNESWMRGPSF